MKKNVRNQVYAKKNKLSQRQEKKKQNENITKKQKKNVKERMELS